MIVRPLLYWIKPEITLPRTSLWYQAGSRYLRSVRWGQRLILPMGQHSQITMSSRLGISKWVINELTLALCNWFICLSLSLMKCSCMHNKTHLVLTINVGVQLTPMKASFRSSSLHSSCQLHQLHCPGAPCTETLGVASAEVSGALRKNLCLPKAMKIYTSLWVVFWVSSTARSKKQNQTKLAPFSFISWDWPLQ